MQNPITLGDLCVEIHVVIVRCVVDHYLLFCHFNDNFHCCRCKEDDHFVYSGERCDITTEKLALESKYIIAIVCGIVAVFIVIFIVVCVACKRRRKENDDNYYM